MINLIQNYIQDFKSKTRGGVAKRNILLSFFIKVGNVLINILYVPLLINTLGKTEYGVWLTLTSVLGWFAFFDIGIGNGLRNKFAEAKAKGDTNLAKIYVSTTYAIVSIIFISIGVVTVLIIPHLEWNKILNTDSISSDYLIRVINIVFVFFILRFITQLINVILLSDQKTALSSSLNLIANSIIIITIFIIKYLNLATLLVCSAILSFVPIIVHISFSLYFYSKEYRAIKPSFSFVQLKHAKSLFNLGIKFLIVQISGLIFYSATNLLITQLFSPNEVTIYNIAFKYFGVGNMIFGIILTPMWSAITEAYTQNDLYWIKRVMKKLKYFAVLLSSFIIILLLFSETFYNLWIGDDIKIPFNLSFVFALSSLTYLFFSPYSLFLNGVSKIKLNMILVIIQSIFYLPVAYLLSIKFNLGVAGIVLGGLICELPLRVSQPIQYHLLINRKAYGIWNK